MNKVYQQYLIFFGFLAMVAAGTILVEHLKKAARGPASLGGLEIPELLIEEKTTSSGYEIYMSFEDEGQNICDYEKELVINIKPEGIIIYSDSDDSHSNHDESSKLYIRVSNSCERDFVSPIFVESFCGDDILDLEDNEATKYKLINKLGVSIKDTPPREWRVESLSIGGEEVSLVNQPGLAEKIFSCR